MRGAWLVAGIGVVAQLIAGSPAVPAKRPPRCPAGRYLVVGDALIVGDTAVPREPIVVDGRRISIGNVCPDTSGQLTATAKATTIKATWRTCGAQRKVRLRARIDSTCRSLRGTLKAKGQPLKPVNAVLSVCGDFFIDPGNAEECEPPDTPTCDAKCRVAVPQTTTSTIGSGISTTTTIATTSSTSSTSTTLMTCLTDHGLTVVDDCTGLEWEKKTLQNVANKYSIGGAATWLAQLNAANFAGHDDWRLPRMASVGPIATDDPAELETILEAAAPPPRIDPLFGPTKADAYWSGSRAYAPPPAPQGYQYPAGIDFGSGFPFFAGLDFAAHVRAVRYAAGVSPTSTTTSSTSTSSIGQSSSSSTTSTTQPDGATCRNGLLEPPGEQCDAGDDFACPGRCTPECQCPIRHIDIVRAHFARTTPIVHAVPALMPIHDEPVAGQSYPVFLGLNATIDDPSLELVAVGESESVLATASLVPCNPNLLPACLQGSVVIPAEPFRLRVRGQARGEAAVSTPGAKVFSPAPVSLEFLGEESEGLEPGSTSRLSYRITNPGPERDFTVEVEDPGHGIVATPDPALVHVGAGAAVTFAVIVSIPAGTPMFHDVDLRIRAAASDDETLRNTTVQSLLVEGR